MAFVCNDRALDVIDCIFGDCANCWIFDDCTKLFCVVLVRGLNKYDKLGNCGKFEFVFTPHLSPMFRGILSTIYVDINKERTINSIYKELVRFYKRSKFVKINKMNSLVSTNDVINTNNCIISVCKSKYKDKAIILSTIDNLIKGGAGQAVQNMNILKDFNPSEGLK